MNSAPAFRVVSWNVNWRASNEQRVGQLRLIADLAPDLLLLQEVSAVTLRPFAQRYDWSVFALGANPNDPRWTSRIGTAVLGNQRFRVKAQMLVAPTWFRLGDDLRWKANRFARRATWAELELANGAGPLLVGSLHASPAAGDIAEHKPWYHSGVARWLDDVTTPWLFGIDANTPAVDSLDPTATRWCWPKTEAHPGEDELLGSLAQHDGRDLFRVWIDQQPEAKERLRRERPDGPLAVSHRLRSGPVRYDHCWATPDVKVQRIEYLAEAFQYSDHAAIVADLRYAPRAQSQPAGTTVLPSTSRGAA